MSVRADWFQESRYGLFIHWGPYAVYGRGEQILFREHLSQTAYASAACSWHPTAFDAREWAAAAKRGGFKYAVLTSRHHDGFCLWDSKATDYTSASQSSGRDFVKEFVEAFREAGLRVGIYYSLADWRIPAYWEGPVHDSDGWSQFRSYVHRQVSELLSNYGKIDVIWFDGAWPHSAADWGSEELIRLIRSLQPDILINNRLDYVAADHWGNSTDLETPGDSDLLGDFGTPEHHITEDGTRPWESCQVSTWRLWGFHRGERWRGADFLLDMLVEATQKGGNLLLNVGPDANGRFPKEFIERSDSIGTWLAQHGECVYGGSETGEVCEFVSYGRQIKRGNILYLVVRFWDGATSLRLAGLKTRALGVEMLTTRAELSFKQAGDVITLFGLPEEPPTPLFPVIKITFSSPPEASSWAAERLWSGDPRRMTSWAQDRGQGFNVDGTAHT